MNNQNPPPNVYMGGNPQYMGQQMPPQQMVPQQGMPQGIAQQPPMYNQGMPMGQYSQQRMMQQQQQHMMMGEHQQPNMLQQQQMMAQQQQQQMMSQGQYQRHQMVHPSFGPQIHQNLELPLQLKKPIFERVKNLLPPTLSFELLDKTDEMSIIQLCMQGREIVTELSIRFMNVLTTLRMGDRRNHLTDIEAMLTYIRFLFKKLLEIRIRIDRARVNEPEVSDESFFKYITEKDGPPADEASERKEKALKTFETNRIAIVNKGNAIKKLEWVFAVIDPQYQDM
ncbi:unnamed protein product [Bursaphelenchus xylophilus]|nr:unnamed protein product [Bursaphelenchus xylophilus]CAG9099880.1 unnamed protein product [Bursaphelenchus xylophilus]